jgi:hypothetical protein
MISRKFTNTCREMLKRGDSQAAAGSSEAPYLASTSGRCLQRSIRKLAVFVLLVIAKLKPVIQETVLFAEFIARPVPWTGACGELKWDAK